MTEQLQKFLEFASEDEELCNKVNGLKDRYQDQNEVIQACIDLAGEHGFVLTADDFKEDHPAIAKELSDDELENVAGGGTCACVLGGGGAATGIYDDTCGCAIAGAGMLYSVKWGKKVGRCACPAVGAGSDNPMY